MAFTKKILGVPSYSKVAGINKTAMSKINSIVGGASYRADTLAYKARVEADGGIVYDINYVDAIYAMVAAQGISSLGKVWISPNAGVKIDGSRITSKAYNLFGTLDASQADTPNMPYHTINGKLWNNRSYWTRPNTRLSILNLPLQTYLDVFVWYDLFSGGFDNYYGHNSASEDGYELYNGGTFSIGRNSAEHKYNSNSIQPNSTCSKSLITARYNATLGVPKVYVDGVEKTPSSITGTLRANTIATKELSMWKSSATPEAITDYVVFNELTDTNYNAVYNFIDNAYRGIKVICDGDSNVSGLGASSAALAFPQAMRTLIKNDVAYSKAVSVYNYGVSGQTISNQVADIATQINPLYKAGDIYVTFNYDNTYKGDTIENVYAETKAMVLAQTAAGFKVVVLTAINLIVTGKPAWSTDYLWLNNQIKTDLATYPNVYILDIGARTEFQNYNNLTYYNADQVHLKDAGLALIAADLKALIATI